MTRGPQALQGWVSNGARSRGMNTRASQPPQVTIFNRDSEP